MIGKVNGFSINSNQNRQNISFGRCRFFREKLPCSSNDIFQTVRDVAPEIELSKLKGLIRLARSGHIKPRSDNFRFFNVSAKDGLFCLQRYEDRNLLSVYRRVNKSSREGIVFVSEKKDRPAVIKAFKTLNEVLDELVQSNKTPIKIKPNLSKVILDSLRLPSTQTPKPVPA